MCSNFLRCSPRIRIWVICCLLSPNHLLAKTAADFVDPLVDVFIQSISSVDEFIQRFNGKELYPGLDKEDPELGFHNFACTFNSEIGGVKGFDNEDFMEHVRAFYDAVAMSQTKLSFDSKCWLAQQEVSFKHGKKEIGLSLIMQTDTTDLGLRCWTIAGIRGISQIMPPDSLKRMVISPEQNEMGFRELESAMKYDSKHFSRFSSRGLRLDPTTYFMALVENGAIKFKDLGDTSYYFCDVPGYIFKVEFFDRVSANSGWLISEFWECDDRSKELFINQLLGR